MLADAKVIWFYVALFLLILLVKKLRKIRVAINGIWFSCHGKIPEDVVKNFIQIACDIKKSGYKHHYHLYFWTDKKKLISTVKRQFKKNKIIIKDYRDAFLADSVSRQAKEWMHQLLKLGDENNKLFFVLASDIFRLHLLLKTFPARYSYSHVCYFDCNDINFVSIPEPRVFRKLKSIALHFSL